MGNNKFKFSDMIPNAWFYKLKDMSKTKTRTNNKQTTKKKLAPTTNTQQQKPKPSHPKNKTQKIKTTTATTTTTTKTEVQPTTRSADKFPPPQNHVSKPWELIRFPEAPPRQSTKRISSISRRKVPVLKPNYSRSFLSSSESSSSDENVPSEVDSELDFVNESSWSSSCNYKCRLSASTADIIIDLNDDKHASSDHVQLKTTTAKQDNGFVDVVTEMIDLPPILTKPINFDDTVFEATKHRSSSRSTGILSSDDQEKIMKTRRDHKTTNNNDNNNNARKSLSGSSGIRLRTNSPRLASKKIQAYARKSVSSRNRHLSESVAVVKSSVDPQRDFRDSMVEMIVENNIRASKDLEELLACYLSLNSQEYHDVIVMAFEQIWFDMADLL